MPKTVALRAAVFLYILDKKVCGGGQNLPPSSARVKGIIRVSKLKRVDFICHFSDSLYPGDSNDMHS